MKTFVVLMLSIAIAVIAALTATSWKNGEWFFVGFGVSLLLILVASIYSVARSKEEMDSPDPVSEEDQQLFYEAQDQFFETKFQKQVKFGVAIVLSVLGFIGFVVYLVWGGF